MAGGIHRIAGVCVFIERAGRVEATEELSQRGGVTDDVDVGGLERERVLITAAAAARSPS